MKRIVAAFCMAILLFAAAAVCTAGEISKTKPVKAVFDFRIGNPQSAALHMDLIHSTFKEMAKERMQTPSFVVIFIGPSVKLISKNRAGFSADENKAIDDMTKTISAMSKDGIKFEVCLAAAKVLGVDPATILPGIKHASNGWIPEIDYQAMGYSLVLAY